MARLWYFAFSLAEMFYVSGSEHVLVLWRTHIVVKWHYGQSKGAWKASVLIDPYQPLFEIVSYIDKIIASYQHNNAPYHISTLFRLNYSIFHLINIIFFLSDISELIIFIFNLNHAFNYNRWVFNKNFYIYYDSNSNACYHYYDIVFSYHKWFFYSITTKNQLGCHHNQFKTNVYCWKA